jgi:hypothetical protein
MPAVELTLIRSDVCHGSTGSYVELLCFAQPPHLLVIVFLRTSMEKREPFEVVLERFRAPIAEFTILSLAVFENS